jgi:hypothetical protein
LETTVGGLETTVGGLETTVAGLETTVGGLTTTTGGLTSDLLFLNTTILSAMVIATGAAAGVAGDALLKANKSLGIWDESGVNVYHKKSGNVGIGITFADPLTNKLEVDGNVNIPTGSTYRINNIPLSYSDLVGSIPIANPKNIFVYMFPSFGTSGGIGDRIICWNGTASSHPFSLGIYNSTLWYSVPGGRLHKFNTGGVPLVSMDSKGLAIGLDTALYSLHVPLPIFLGVYGVLLVLYM